MASFSYTARNKTGGLVQGALVAGSKDAVAEMLVDKGLIPILIKPAKKSGSLLDRFKGGKVKMMDKVIFSRQFATMINAGVPIAQSLTILREQSSSKKFQAAITDIGKRVEGGSSLANAMAEHPDVFSEIYINMVKAGETGGILDQVLERLATQQEKDAEIVSKVRGAMIYPGVITSVTIIAFIFLMTVIVPKLSVIFESFGANLPVYTRVMLAISHALTHDGLIIGGVSAAIIIAIVRYVHTSSGKRVFDRLVLKAPIFGKILVKVNIARFARTFGSLMASGISVLDAINATSSALSSTVYQDELKRCAAEVKNGKPVSAPLKESKNFPPIVAQMMSVGEETGKLDEILLKLAGFYENEVDNVVANITSVIEPVLIIVLGGMVGSVVISVFGPIATLSQQVK